MKMKKILVIGLILAILYLEKSFQMPADCKVSKNSTSKGQKVVSNVICMSTADKEKQNQIRQSKDKMRKLKDTIRRHDERPYAYRMLSLYGKRSFS